MLPLGLSTEHMEFTFYFEAELTLNLLEPLNFLALGMLMFKESFLIEPKLSPESNSDP